VELMVVIAIIGVVVTLAASATMQLVARQKSANTELTIQKVNEALKAHWRAVIDQARNEKIPDKYLYGDATMQGLLAMAGSPNDADAVERARIIWIKLRLKQEFPMSFMEALVPTHAAIKSPNGKLYVFLPPAAAFAPWQQNSRFVTTLVCAQPQSYESSVCLLLALSQSRRGVTPFDQDRLASTELADASQFNPTATGFNLKTIVDAWGRPLTFYRWPIGGEVDKSDPNARNVASGTLPHNSDPLDPDGLLMSPTWNHNNGQVLGAYGLRGGVWAFEKLLHPVHDVDNLSVYTPRSYYSVPVIASAGPSIGGPGSVYALMGLPSPQEQPPFKTPPNVPPLGLPTAVLHDPMKMAQGTPAYMGNPTADSNDNIYSFRMRLGARGD
jgi:hypothetical protein